MKDPLAYLSTIREELHLQADAYRHAGDTEGHRICCVAANELAKVIHAEIARQAGRSERRPRSVVKSDHG